MGRHDHPHQHGHDCRHAHEPVSRSAPPAGPIELHDARIVHPHGPEHAGVHVHEHGHDRVTDRRLLYTTVGITGAILVAEVVGGLLSGSLALLSDAGHVLTDLSAQLLSLLALLFAARPADARRTYGYYRLEILAALANGLALVLLAGFIVYSAYRRLASPPEVKTGLMLVVATGGLVANLVAAWLLHGAHTLNVRGAYLHVLSDSLASAAVVAGGIVMAVRRGLYIIDPILGFVIGLVVIYGAFRLIREAVDVLLEAVPGDIDLESVRDDVRRIEGIEDVHDLHIWTITSGLHALSAHIVVREGTLVAENDALLRAVKEVLLRRHRIAHSTLQVESTAYEHVGHVH